MSSAITNLASRRSGCPRAPILADLGWPISAWMTESLRRESSRAPVTRRREGAPIAMSRSEPCSAATAGTFRASRHAQVLGMAVGNARAIRVVTTGIPVNPASRRSSGEASARITPPPMYTARAGEPTGSSLPRESVSNAAGYSPVAGQLHLGPVEGGLCACKASLLMSTRRGPGRPVPAMMEGLTDGARGISAGSVIRKLCFVIGYGDATGCRLLESIGADRR